MNSALHSSIRMDWATPRDFFAAINQEFDFTIDVCASPDNACLPRYWTSVDNALDQDWRGERCWMNPPYGRAIGHWMNKAHIETSAWGAELVVCLVPARIDTRWWIEHAAYADEVRFISGRMWFEGATDYAPFPNALIVFRRQRKHDDTKYTYINRHNGATIR